MKLPREIYNALVEESRRAFPKESCGFLVADQSQMHIYFIRNVADDPTTQFQFDPQTQIDALLYIIRSGMKVEAIWHTHPSGELIPSKMDLAGASFQHPDIKHLIVGSSLIVEFWIDHNFPEGFRTGAVTSH